MLQSALALEPREADYLQHYQQLSRHFPPDLIQAALETAILRHEAQAKFPTHIASCLYLTREALEQATSYTVSAYRANQYQSRLNPAQVIDLGCSIGGDTLALAGFAQVIGIDLDALRLRMAHANLSAIKSLPASDHISQVDFVQADLTCSLPFASATSAALFFDPARRSAHRRVFSVQNYQPPLSIINQWLPGFPALGVKLSPGVELNELSGYQAEIEFISLQGELKECMLWFGPLRQTNRRATLLPAGHQLSADAPDADLPGNAPISSPQAYLYEPDPAVLRAGLVRRLAGQINATQLDPDIAYLTSQVFTPTPFARAWAVQDWFPFQLKRLRAYLRQQGIGRVTVKKRGSPLDPQFLIRELRLSGEISRTLVLTHYQAEPVVIICLPEVITSA
jgi:hypothetical protein